MANPLEAILEEVKRLKLEGAADIYLADDTLRQLRALTNEKVSAKTQLPQQGTSASTSTSPLIDMLQEHEQASNQKTRTQAAKTPVKQVPPDAPTPSATIPEPPQLHLPEGDKQTRWEWLRQQVLNCPVCRQHTRLEQGKKIVFGVGNLDAEIFFCGEAPGAEEEEQGEPFVGKAGQLLTKIIEAMGLKREQVYIGNVMNWRPQMPSMEVGNRPPDAREMAFCLPYLRAQLAIVQPKAIVALGNTAVKGLLGDDPKRRMRDLRGNWNSFEGTPLMVTYHPSYLLRNETLQTKRAVWEDMLLVMEHIGMPISDKQRAFFLSKR